MVFLRRNCPFRRGPSWWELVWRKVNTCFLGAESPTSRLNAYNTIQVDLFDLVSLRDEG